MSKSTSRTCRLITLGCKVNQYETQYVKEALEWNGYREAGEEEAADLCIVNTCTVTGEADAKGRQLIRRLHQANPAAAIVVMGCFATRDPETVRRLPGVARVITDKKHMLDDLRDFGVEQQPAGITRFDGHQRAFVKVQDGCILNCTYCILPQVRPGLRSRSIEDIRAEVEQLVAAGHREIVLTGIHLGHYGIDLSRGRPKEEWRRLWHLIEDLDAMPGDFRIRLSSLEAAEVRGEFVDALARSRRLCPHLHLCLQSGSDRILALMKRRYRAASFMERCRRLRVALDMPALTTDVIVGFPGETEADFDATCQVAREVGFSRIHVFSFSARRGTPAASLPTPVPPQVIAERRRRPLALDQELAEGYFRGLIGRRLDVLVEGADPVRPGHVRGTSCRYAPVAFEGYAPALIRRRVTVVADCVVDGVILAKSQPSEDPADVRLGEMVGGRTPLPQVD